MSFLFKNGVYSVDQIRKIEDLTIKSGLSVASLMEKAGLKMAAFIKKKYRIENYKSVGVFVGSGHNGADALVIARELHLSGYAVFLYLTNERLKSATQGHLDYFLSISGKRYSKLDELKKCDFLIDGIYGIGLNRELEKNDVKIIKWINEQKKPIVSVDIPSGMHADFGSVLGSCVCATETLCLGLLKRGFFADQAVDYVGKLHFLDLNFSDKIIEKIIKIKEKTPQVLVLKSVESLEIKKKKSSYKYSNGISLLFAGSKEYFGAGILCAQGSVASGVGYNHLCAEEHLRSTMAAICPDVVSSNFDKCLLKIDKYSKYKTFAILCGSGLGKSARNSLTSIIEKINSQKREFYPPLILDADVLVSSETNMRNIQKYKGTKIITPHSGEFRNMFPDIFELHAQDKIECAKLAAKKIGGIVVLKGPHTVIAHSDGRVYVNLKSTQALARAGTGDVLAGFITGLLAQGIDPFLACCIGVVIHSRTALKLEKKWGVFVVNAFLLSKNLNKVFSEFSSKI